MPSWFDTGWMLACVLLWTRLGTLLLASSLFTSARVPATAVVLLSLVLAGLLAASLGLRAPSGAGGFETVGSFALAVGAEASTGLLLGFALQCAFAAFGIAGQVLDVQMGFGMGSILNPVTRVSSPVMSTLLTLFGVVFFFSIDGPQALVRGLVFSLQQVPPGRLWQASPEALMRPVGAMFTAGVALVAPVLFLLLLLELAAMFASRALPQMNVFFVAVPAKILCGLCALAMASPYMAPAMQRTFMDVFRYWDGVLR